MTNLSFQSAWDEPSPETGPAGMSRQDGVLEPRSSSQISAALVVGHVEARKKRATFFEAGMFSDPAWDLLLWLYVEHLEQRRVTITQLTLKAGVPQTTALRWLGQLHTQGWVTKTQDPLDDRRVFVGLSFRGWVAFNSYFASCGYAPPEL